MNPYDEPEVRRARQEEVALAEAMLKGEVGILEGSQRMLARRYRAGVDEFDEDFLLFVAIESQGDHLPVGAIRRHWSPAALERFAPEIEEAEAVHRPAALSACESIIARFRQA